MSGFLDTVTGQLVVKALDVNLAQRVVIANNVANVNTAGYKPLRLEFDQVFERLGNLIAEGANVDKISNEINNLRIDALPVTEAGATVMLDEEMVRMTKNALHYEALLTANSKLSALLKNAIKGGKP